jgi:hypothetical protein
MAKMADTAQMAMDMYFQNFKTDEDFFHLYHFTYLCGIAYARILEDEFKEARAQSKAESGYTTYDIALQSDWLIEKELDVKKHEDREDDAYYVDLPVRPFSFPYDPYGYGIQSVRGKGQCNNFVRATSRIEQQLCVMPTTSRIFYFPQAKRLELRNMFCHLDKITVVLLPDIEDPELGPDGGDIPKSKEDMVIGRVMQLMMAARNGTVVDMSNNSNPNKALATEIDNLFANLRTRPS